MARLIIVQLLESGQHLTSDQRSKNINILIVYVQNNFYRLQKKINARKYVTVRLVDHILKIKNGVTKKKKKNALNNYIIFYIINLIIFCQIFINRFKNGK